MGPAHFSGDWKQWAAMEPELDPQQKALRDRFCDEYMLDSSPLNAARRVGFSNAFAKEYAEKFMTEPYVRQRIAYLERRPVDDPEAQEELDKRVVRARLMREAHDPFSNGASRVSALKQLCSILGMDAPTRIQQQVEHRGGVMVVPPISSSLDEWERTAIAQQAALVESAQSDVH